LLVDIGLFLLIGGILFWTAFMYFLVEKPQTRLFIKIGIVAFLLAYLAMHFLLVAVFGDSPAYLTIDDAGDRVNSKEAGAVVLAGFVTYAILSGLRARLHRK
jgi:hypothetical protein